MKKLLLLLVMMLACNFATAQHKVFCELLGHGKLFSTKVTVTVDFGQNQWQNNKLVDENGKNLVFNSMVDAMNFMGKLGWEFEQAYVVTMGGQNVYHWLLSKTIEEDETISEGFKIKADYQAEQKAAQSEEQVDTEQNQKEKRSRSGWAQDDLYD